MAGLEGIPAACMRGQLIASTPKQQDKCHMQPCSKHLQLYLVATPSIQVVYLPPQSQANIERPDWAPYAPHSKR